MGYSVRELRWADFSKKAGLDLIIAGHQHNQEVHYQDGMLADIGDTAWVVSGGGGGITSDGGDPTANGEDDAYGFMDLEISLETIIITAISHGGVVRNQTTVYPRAPSPVQASDVDAELFV